MTRTPKKGQPLLVWVPDEVYDHDQRIVVDRIGTPESAHGLNDTQRVDMAHAVIGCGRCGGVYGGDGVRANGGRCPTKRCVCRGRTSGQQSSRAPIQESLNLETGDGRVESHEKDRR